MNKQVMLSIRPQWVEKILNGEKTIEVRKREPNLKPPFTVYMYVTKGKPILGYEFVSGETSGYGFSCQNHIDDFDELKYLANGKVVASFVVDKIYKLKKHDYAKAYHKPDRYIPDVGFNWILDNCCLTDDELWDYGKGKDLYAWHISELKVFDKPRELSEYAKPRKSMEQVNKYYIHKAPQSFMYCYEPNQ